MYVVFHNMPLSLANTVFSPLKDSSMIAILSVITDHLFPCCSALLPFVQNLSLFSCAKFSLSGNLYLCHSLYIPCSGGEYNCTTQLSPCLSVWIHHMLLRVFDFWLCLTLHVSLSLFSVSLSLSSLLLFSLPLSLSPSLPPSPSTYSLPTLLPLPPPISLSVPLSTNRYYRRRLQESAKDQ